MTSKENTAQKKADRFFLPKGFVGTWSGDISSIYMENIFRINICQER